MGHGGGLIVELQRWKTVPSAIFYKVDYQPGEWLTSGRRSALVLTWQPKVETWTKFATNFPMPSTPFPVA